MSRVWKAIDRSVRRFGEPRNRLRRRATIQRRPMRCEVLEDRRLLSINPFPAPLAAVDPLGSLIYEGSLSSDISVVDEVDSYTVDVDPHQTITVLGNPDAGLDLALTLIDPSSATVASADANGVGLDEVILTYGPTVSGTYTIEVSDVAGGTGNYSLDVILNAAIELEEHDGPRNDDPRHFDKFVFHVTHHTAPTTLPPGEVWFQTHFSVLVEV